MSSSYLLLRRREARLRRFGLALGGVLALAFHLAMFWGPKVGYRPVLEQARVRRVLVARPYQPVPPAPPPKPSPARPEKAAAAPQPTPRNAQAPPAPPSPLPAPRAAAGDAQQHSVAKVADTAPDAARARTKGDADVTRTPAQDDAWTAMLASLQGRKTDIQEKWQGRKAEIEAQSAAVDPADTRWGDEGKDQDGEGYLDSRIRMTVVSYPPSSIETDRPRIPYPVLRFRRAELQKGTCRVWYRVWTDGRGEIVRTQLKTPDTAEERELYAEFVTQVEQSVAEWPFPRQEAEVHIDVFFQIE